MRLASIANLFVGWWAIAGCSSGDVALGGPDTLVRVDRELAGANCDGGGIAVHSGLDDDGDFYLDDAEIDLDPVRLQWNLGGAVPGRQHHHRHGRGQRRRRLGAALRRALRGRRSPLVGVDSDAAPTLDLSIVTGDIVVAANADLASLEGLGALREVGGTYLIQGNDALTSLAGLGSIERAQALVVVGNNSLVDLSGVEQLDRVRRRIRVTNNPVLTALTGLENLESLSAGATVRANPQLASLSALSLAPRAD